MGGLNPNWFLKAFASNRQWAKEFENWSRLMNEREQVLRFHNTTWAQMHEYDTNVATKLHVAKSEAVLLRV